MNNKLLSGRFTVLRSLGQGGMSEVFLAHDAVLSGEVALKMIHPHHARNPLVLERFRKEVGISRKVRHPGIIRIFDLHEDPETGSLFLSMEYLPGGNLKTRIQTRDRLPVREALAIGMEALSALEAAHEAGIVHRDIKPHNLLFTAEGNVKLSDFGLSRTCVGADVFSDTASAGTPEYCAPEIALGEYADSRSDLYSLGITLFEALSGRLPFTGSDPYLVLKQQADSPAPGIREFLPDVPAELEAILKKALEKDPSDRFQTAREFREALADLNLKAAPAARCEYSCPRCGEPLVSTLPHCFRCGETVLDIVPSAAGAGRYSVVVLGTGKPGDKLPADDRSRILSLVRREDLKTVTLEKSIPRVPFVLIQGLDRSSAATLASRITSLGIPARVSGKGLRAENRSVRKAMTRKVLALSPRAWLILLGSSSGLYAQIGNMNMQRFMIFILFGAVALFAAVPGALAFGTTRPNAAFREKGGKRANPFRNRFLEASARLTSPVLQGLLKSAARKLDTILKLSEESTLLAEADRRELIAELETSADEWCGLLERIQGIETILRSDSEAAFESEILRLEELLLPGGTEAGGNAGEQEKAAAEKLRLGAMLRDRRELERLRDRSFDVLLRFTSGLDRIALGLGKAGAADTAGKLRETAAALSEALEVRTAFLELGDRA